MSRLKTSLAALMCLLAQAHASQAGDPSCAQLNGLIKNTSEFIAKQYASMVSDVNKIHAADWEGGHETRESAALRENIIQISKGLYPIIKQTIEIAYTGYRLGCAQGGWNNEYERAKSFSPKVMSEVEAFSFGRF